MNRVMREWCNSVQRTLQRTEECLGQASTTEITSDVQKLMDELDVINQRCHTLLEFAEKMLKRNPSVSSKDYIYQIKEKKSTTRTNALIELGTAMTFAGRQFGENTTYGKCLLSVGNCQDQLGYEELRFVTQAAIVFLNPMKRFMDSSLRRALKERRALTGCRLDMDAARHRLKKTNLPEKQAAAETIVRTTQAQYERQLELTRLCCENVQREKLTQVQGLVKLVNAQLEYFQKSSVVLENVRQELLVTLNEAESTIERSSTPLLSPREQLVVEEKKSVLEEMKEPDILLPPPMPEIRARILDAFHGKTASEVTVAEDEIVAVVDNFKPNPRESSGWLLVKKASGQVGYVPRDHLELMNDEKWPGVGDGADGISSGRVMNAEQTTVKFTDVTKTIQSNVSQIKER